MIKLQDVFRLHLFLFLKITEQLIALTQFPGITDFKTNEIDSEIYKNKLFLYKNS